jgi:hypothetical protein
LEPAVQYERVNDLLAWVRGPLARVEIRLIGSARTSPKIILRIENKEFNAINLAQCKSDVVIDPINYEFQADMRKLITIAKEIAATGSFIGTK